MSITTYTFKVTLLGSRDPLISRTFTIPASSTFQRLHRAIQYTFDWDGSHLHSFTFSRSNVAPGDFEAIELLQIGSKGGYTFDGVEKLGEKDVKLSDIWDENGLHRTKVLENGNVASLIYLYDMGDYWTHDVQFVSQGTSDHKGLTVTNLSGRGPLDDSGGVEGWEGIKKAFRAASPDVWQKERIEWAREVGRDYNPDEELTLEHLNRAGGFKG